MTPSRKGNASLPRPSKKPKTRAGRRTVAIPPPLIPVLEDHLARYAAPGPDGYAFVGPKGGWLRADNWTEEWRQATEALELPGIGLHDVRRAAGTMAAQTVATALEVQSRLGHASPDTAHR